MGVVFRPVGPQPPSVYWVRRLVVLVAIIVVVGLAWWLLPFGGSSGDANNGSASQSTESPTTSPSPTVSSTPEPSKTKTTKPASTPTEAPCEDSDIVVTVTTDADTYPAGQDPTFSLSVATKSKQPCVRDLGQGALELKVSSGGLPAWSSDDCNPDGGSKMTVLTPGSPYVQGYTWNRTLSEAENCPSGTASAGRYQVVARNLELFSNSQPFTLE